MKRALLFITVLATLLLLPGLRLVFAQEAATSGIAVVVDMKDQKTEEGDLISYQDTGYVKSNTPYDAKLFGVITDHPAVTLEDPNPPETKAVITSGKAYVKVITANGPIKAGDVITSSSTPGVGQKALENGQAIGTALEDYTASDPKKVGKILVVLQISYHYASPYARENLVKNFSEALKAPVQTPMNALRYLVAGFIIVFCIIIGITFFGRAAVAGVQGIGRNPLAERAITYSVILHLILTLAVMAVGIIIGYLILAV